MLASLLSRVRHAASTPAAPAPTQRAAEKSRGLAVRCPVEGEIKPLESCSDEVFAKGMMGPGALVLPRDGKVVAPVDGKIEVLFDTLHAFGFRTADGVEVMLHVGIDTVELGGEPFVAHVAQGDTVKEGDLLLDMDLAAIEAAGKSSETLVIVTDARGGDVRIAHFGWASAGEPMLTIA